MIIHEMVMNHNWLYTVLLYSHITQTN